MRLAPATLLASSWLLLGAAAPTEPGSGPFDAAVPATWRASAKLGPGTKAREALVAEWIARARVPYEKALTRPEAEALLDDPRAEPIYAEKTVSIVAPSMLARQRQHHLDLLKTFQTEERLAAGATFARAWEPALAKAQQAHGVDRAAIVSILMFETRLGEYTGEYVAFNALVSQAFFAQEAMAVVLAGQDGKAERKALSAKLRRERVQTIQARARTNLAALVRQCKAKGIDPFSLKGSWAGALGYPQFMPASLRWAEDGDGDGTIDLFGFPDAIASIARYLKDHGWAKSPQKAVWGYNHEAAYVSGVLSWAKALEQELAKSAAAAPAKASPAGVAGAPPKPAEVEKTAANDNAAKAP